MTSSATSDHAVATSRPPANGGPIIVRWHRCGERGPDDGLRDKGRHATRTHASVMATLKLGGEGGPHHRGRGAGPRPARYKLSPHETCRNRPSQGSYGPAQRGTARQVQGPERVAVGDCRRRAISESTVGLAASQVIGPDQLEGRLDGLGTARDRVDRGIVHRQHRGDFGGVEPPELGRERAAVRVGKTAPQLGRP